MYRCIRAPRASIRSLDDEKDLIAYLI